ncbi:MAG: aromatic amino acid transport family protein [Gordonibacter sp.]
MHNKLTTWQAACIITGYGVGSGIMTLPFLVDRAGLLPSLAIMLAAFFFSYCMHMMLAEITLGSGKGIQVISVFRTYLFRGKHGNVFVVALFALTTVVLITNLAAYVAGGAEIFIAAGLPPLAAQIAFYVIAAGEAASVSAIIVIVIILAVASLFNWHNPLPFGVVGQPNEILAFFGMSMFAFVAFFSVPQAVEGLDRDPVKVRRAILIGLGLNFLFVVVIVACSLGSSARITQLAMIGWSEGIGPWAQVLGSIFTILAMLTTYWSISLALSDIIEEQTKLNRRICWLIATLPSLLLVLLNLGGFLDIMRTAGGLIAILMAFLVVPAFRRCRRANGKLLLPNALASTPMQIIVLLAFLLMAVGSAVSL